MWEQSWMLFLQMTKDSPEGIRGLDNFEAVISTTEGQADCLAS